MSEIQEIARQIRDIKYALNHVNERQYKDFIDYKQQLDITLHNLQGFLRFSDSSYCVNFILQLQQCNSERELRRTLKGNQYIEYYVVLIKGLEVRKALGSYISLSYASCKVNLAELQEVQKRISARITDCEELSDRILLERIQTLLTDINTSKGM